MKIIDMHSALGHQARLCPANGRGARPAAGDVAFGPGLQDRRRDGPVFSRQRCARDPRSRLLEVSAARANAISPRLFLRYRARASRCDFGPLVSYRPVDGSRRNKGTAPLHRQSRRFCRLCGVCVQIAAGQRSIYAPFYKLCIEAGIPILFFVGTTGLGAGLPGGGGVILDNCHPRHLDLWQCTTPS